MTIGCAKAASSTNQVRDRVAGPTVPAPPCPRPRGRVTALVVFSTCPAEQAATIATALVEEKLAACVTIIGGARSIYRWAQRTESAAEDLLMIKVTASNYEQLEERLRTLHPYALPEILAIPVERGLAAYLAWLADPDHH